MREPQPREIGIELPSAIWQLPKETNGKFDSDPLVLHAQDHRQHRAGRAHREDPLASAKHDAAAWIQPALRARHPAAQSLRRSQPASCAHDGHQKYAARLAHVSRR
jgi:hypothetical protein